MSDVIRNQIIGFLQELDDGVVVRRYVSRSITKEEMIDEVSAGTDEGNRYCSDLLRISRDMIARRAVADTEPSKAAPGL